MYAQVQRHAAYSALSHSYWSSRYPHAASEPEQMPSASPEPLEPSPVGETVASPVPSLVYVQVQPALSQSYSPS